MKGQGKEGSECYWSNMATKVTFKHNNDNLTVKEFYDRYHSNLPRLIVVTQGYCGDIGLEEFSIGQVIRIHTYSTQKRVVAKVEKGLSVLEGREISIPVDYGMKFCSLKGGKKSGKEQTLSEILEKHSLPVEVTPSDSHQLMNIQGQERETGKRCQLNLISTYEDRYLLGNAVSDGMLYAQQTAVPVYLPDLRVSIAVGIEGFSNDQWVTSLQNMEQKVMQNVKFHTDFGNPNVAVYSQESATQNDYSDFTYRTPAEYYNMDDILRQKFSHRPSKLVNYIEQVPDTYDFIPADAVSRVPPPTAPKPITDKKAQPVKPLTPPPAPTVPQRPAVFRRPEQSETVQDFPPKPCRVSRAPNVEELKIADLGEWMKELKLDKYINTFAEQGIDGVLLKEMTREDLRNDFGMSTIEAIKLSKFAQTGHVPS
ncbi:uncharacterized protein LOC133187331 isoform X2 [Saccostrea echinata]|uniref:uncharacterized protein LOC133187331 isoform X2 n=1 Tax=Saccostrea echinata TaxID=191078 RepID=UPI002A83181B|nr:uncharacterized protein LOC133187331 isoform X2 [Saccostrea echinata]